jgi:hypothetical protein
MKSLRILSLVLIGFFLFAASDGYAQRLVGLFDLEQGVRAAAMGGAYVGLAEGDLALYYNPAGLAYLHELHLNGMYESRFSRADQGIFTMALPNFAGQLLFLTVNGAVRRDDTGKDLGLIPYSQFGLLLGAGFSLSDFVENSDFGGLSIGSQLKLYSVSTDAAGQGASISITPSAMWTEERVMFGDLPLQVLRFGVIAPDLLSMGISYGSGHHESWGPGLRFGASASTPDGLTFAADLDVMGSFSIGAEWLYRGLELGDLGQADLSIRGGLKNIGSILTPSIGFGLRLGDLRIDYALVIHPDLPDVHRFSISGVFGPPNFLLCALRPSVCPRDDP